MCCAWCCTLPLAVGKKLGNTYPLVDKINHWTGEFSGASICETFSGNADDADMTLGGHWPAFPVEAAAAESGDATYNPAANLGGAIQR